MSEAKKIGMLVKARNSFRQWGGGHSSEVGPERMEFKGRQTKVSCHTQHYSEPQTIYILRVKKGHMNNVHMISNSIQPLGQATFGKNVSFHGGL